VSNHNNGEQCIQLNERKDLYTSQHRTN